MGAAHRLVDALDRRQREARSSRAEDDRSDHDVQPVETAGGKEARHRIGAAFDQDAAEAAVRERRDDRGRRELALVRGQRQRSRRRPGSCRSRVRAGDHEPADTVGRQHPRARRQSAIGIDDDPRRARAFDAPDGQLRIVGDRGAHPDHHRVDQRPQAMQMGETGLSVDVMRVAGGGGDAGVDRLAALPDHDQVVGASLPQRAEECPPTGAGAEPSARRNASGTVAHDGRFRAISELTGIYPSPSLPRRPSVMHLIPAFGGALHRAMIFRWDGELQTRSRKRRRQWNKRRVGARSYLVQAVQVLAARSVWGDMSSSGSSGLFGTPKQVGVQSGPCRVPFGAAGHHDFGRRRIGADAGRRHDRGGLGLIPAAVCARAALPSSSPRAAPGRSVSTARDRPVSRSAICTTWRRSSRWPRMPRSRASSTSFPRAKRRAPRSSSPSSLSSSRPCWSATARRRPCVRAIRRWSPWPPTRWRSSVARRSIRSTVATEATIPLNGGFPARFVIFRDSNRRHGDRRHRREAGLRTTGPGAPALGLPDRRRVRLAALRLRRSASPGAARSSQQHGGGIILYLEQEGRGLGLANKIRTYQLQDAGLDTVDANTVLGFDDDERDYGVAVRMLQVLGCTRVRLLTNNPAKLDGLSQAGIDVSGTRALARPDQSRQSALSHRQGDARRTQARPPPRRASPRPSESPAQVPVSALHAGEGG